MTTTQQVFQEIQAIAVKSQPDLRITEKMAPGEWIRQGDIQIQCLEKLPTALGEPTKNSQLAVGQTQGSRHIINPIPKGLKIYQPTKDASPLIGPVIESPTRWRLTHPEHAHHDLPAGIFQVTYQRDYKKERAEELRRVQD